jgi:hypothetical protein
MESSLEELPVRWTWRRAEREHRPGSAGVYGAWFVGSRLFYVGSTIDLEERRRHHLLDMGRRRGNPGLRAELAVYGAARFRIRFLTSFRREEPAPHALLGRLDAWAGQEWGWDRWRESGWNERFWRYADGRAASWGDLLALLEQYWLRRLQRRHAERLHNDRFAAVRLDESPGAASSLRSLDDQHAGERRWVRGYAGTLSDRLVLRSEHGSDGRVIDARRVEASEALAEAPDLPWEWREIAHRTRWERRMSGWPDRRGRRRYGPNAPDPGLLTARHPSPDGYVEFTIERRHFRTLAGRLGLSAASGR